MGTAILAVRLVLAVVFTVAGVAKLLDLEGSRRAMRDFKVPAGLAGVVGLLLPLAELATAIALIPTDSARWGALAALVLLLLFIGGIAAALRRGEAPDCHCFGQVHSEPAGPKTLIRNGILAAAALLVVVEAPGASLTEWVGDRTAAELVAVVTGILAVGFAGAWFRLWRAQKPLYRELNRAQRFAMSAPPGVPVGAAAPSFSLPSLSGETVTLESLLDRGLPLLLVFVGPACESCHEILPDLARWQATLSERLSVVLISTGRAEVNEPVFAPYGVKDVLLQENLEIADNFRVRGTPSAVLVTADGRVASTPGETTFGIEPLVRVALRDGATAALERPVA